MTSPRERLGAHGTEDRQQWACNSDQWVELCQALHRNLPCRSQRRWRTTTYPKMSWTSWRRKFVIWRSVRWALGFCSKRSRTRVSRFVGHAMTFLTGNNSILFTGKAWFLQETGRCWGNAEWRSKGTFIRGEFQLELNLWAKNVTANWTVKNIRPRLIRSWSACQVCFLL